MKYFIYLTLLNILLTSCSGSDDSTLENEPPTVPILVNPTDNQLCLDNNVSFEWNRSTDVNKDSIAYQIQLAKENTFAQIEKTFEKSDNIASFTLSKNTAYYWRIKAIDSKGSASAFSTIFKFYTSGDAVVNHLPFAPDLTQPLINSVLTGTIATLGWTASDVDVTDVLSYDVYFGSINPPTEKIGDNISTISTTITVEPAKQYFWRVVVKDNKGGETIGQVWKFKTN